MSELLFKVIIIGDATVGKTSFVQRYVHNHPRREYKPTVGVDFALKVIRLSDDTTVRLQLWDIAGQERFTSMTRVYYKGAAACVIMFDLTSQQTFNSTIKWKRDLDKKCTLPNGKTIPCILVGNKSDLATRPVEKEAIDRMCRENAFLGWTEMSVKEDINVTETMDYLLTELMDNYRKDEEKDVQNKTGAEQGGFIELTSHKTAKENTGKLSCCSSS
ncbi:ras-related protein Rab-7L1-like [Orbicella faveolata]|uniref:ras-related protein Rab-7L1-like n=1 Tax=Orbicella faveolata TaxID=48498 RepID=UPI0009E631EB|nr:ras-related protein Rab-7L1-like [Orbicella faveolata]